MILLLRPMLIFCVLLSIGWFLLGLGVSGGGCEIGGFLLFGPLLLRSRLLLVMLELVGVLSLKGAPLALPTFATPGFERFFGLGRAVRFLVPFGCRRFMHLVVLYGYFGADSCAEKLQVTNQLFEAALGELAVVARGQPCLIVGDFNVEPTKIPCLAKVISAGLWVDLEASWAAAAGRDPAVTCKRTWDSDSGNRVISRLDAHCVLLLFFLARFFVIGGFSLILLSEPGLLLIGGLLLLLSCVGLHLFGLHLGSLLLIVPDVLNLLKFGGFGMFMMSGLDGLTLMMPFLLIMLLLLVMFLVLGSLGLVLLRGRC